MSNAPSPHSDDPLGRGLLLLPSVAVPPEAHVVPRVDLLHAPGDRQGVLMLGPDAAGMYDIQGSIL